MNNKEKKASRKRGTAILTALILAANMTALAMPSEARALTIHYDAGMTSDADIDIEDESYDTEAQDEAQDGSSYGYDVSNNTYNKDDSLNETTDEKSSSVNRVEEVSNVLSSNALTDTAMAETALDEETHPSLEVSPITEEERLAEIKRNMRKIQVRSSLVKDSEGNFVAPKGSVKPTMGLETEKEKYTLLIVGNSSTASGGVPGLHSYIMESAMCFVDEMKKMKDPGKVALIVYDGHAGLEYDFTDDLDGIRNRLEFLETDSKYSYVKIDGRQYGDNVPEALDLACEVMSGISGLPGEKNAVLFGMSGGGVPSIYSYDGPYDLSTVGSEWKYTFATDEDGNQIRGYAIANASYQRAQRLKSMAGLYTVALVHTYKNRSEASSALIDLNRLAMKNMATSAEYNYEITEIGRDERLWQFMLDEYGKSEGIEHLFTYDATMYADDMLGIPDQLDIGSGSGAVTGYYHDNMLKGESTMYSPSIATTSMALAMSVCGEAGVVDASEAMESMSGNNIRAYGSMDGKGLTAVIGSKEVERTYEGKKTYITVAISAPENGNGAYMGTEGDHYGYTAGKDAVLSYIREYIEGTGINGGIRLWLTGYAGGGAVANLVAAALDDGADLGSVSYSGEDLYAYCFNAPACADTRNTGDPKYGNIFCVTDPTAVMPVPSTWGLGRYGKELLLPAASQDPGYGGKLAMMKNRYYRHTERKYAPERFRGCDGDMVETAGYPYDLVSFLEALVAKMGTLAGTRYEYQDRYQNGLRDIYSILRNPDRDVRRAVMTAFSERALYGWREFESARLEGSGLSTVATGHDVAEVVTGWLQGALRDAGVAGRYDATKVNDAGRAMAGLLSDLAGTDAGMAATLACNMAVLDDADDPLACLSWLETMDPNFDGDKAVPDNDGRHREVWIHGGASATAVNGDGTAVGSGSGEDIVLLLPGSERCDIRVTPGNEGPMDITVAEYDRAAGMYTRVTGYGSVRSYGDQDVLMRLPAGDMEGYGMTGAAWLSMDEQVCTNPEAAFRTVRMGLDEGFRGRAGGSGKYLAGTHAKLTAVLDSDNATAEWSRDGQDIGSGGSIDVRMNRDADIRVSMKDKTGSGTDPEEGDTPSENSTPSENTVSENTVSENGTPSENEVPEKPDPVEPAVSDMGDILNGDLPEDGKVPDGIWVAGVDDAVYTGAKVTQSFRVYDKNKRLTEKKDYTVSYKNNVNAYTAGASATESQLRAKAPQVVIKMKGNYSGTQYVYFDITPVDISGSAFSADSLTVKYNGRKQTPQPVLTWNGKKLAYNKDFQVGEYATSAFTGAKGKSETYGLTLMGKGNFTGTRTITLTITDTAGNTAGNGIQRVMMSAAAVTSIPDQTYSPDGITADSLKDKSGNAFVPKLTYKGKTLEKGTDYDITGIYGADKPGTARIQFHGLENEASATGFCFSGDKYVTFKVVGQDIKNAVITGLEKSYPYTGNPITPLVGLKGMDISGYDILFSKNISVGTAKVAFRGKGGYSGVRKATFKITAYPMTGTDISVNDGNEISAEYVKGGAAPEVTVSFNGMKLRKDSDYKVTYANNKAVTGASGKKAEIRITGLGNFKGTRTVYFTVTPRSFLTVNARAADVTPGKAGWYKAKVSVYDTDGKLLKAGTDYEKDVKYYDVTKGQYITSGMAPDASDELRAEIKGRGLYSADTVYASYKVITVGKDLSKAVIKIRDQEYTGEALKITDASQISTAYIKNGSGYTNLEYGKDFIIDETSYTGNVKKGAASAVARGIGEYGGSRKVTFKVVNRSIEKWWTGVVVKQPKQENKKN